MFHSVGGGYLNVGADEHRALLQYIKENEADLIIIPVLLWKL